MPQPNQYDQIPKEDRLLTEMQQAFVREYIADPSSIHKAAIRAGYSIETATASGSRLMADPRVKKLVQEARDSAVQRTGITTERVLQELWRVAGANPGDVVTIDADGEATLNPDKAAEVVVTNVTGAGKKVKSVTTKTIKPADKLAALDKIAKILNLFPKEDKVEVSLSFADLVTKSIKDKEDTSV